MNKLKKSDIKKKGEFQVKRFFFITMLVLSVSAGLFASQDALPGADISIRFYNRTVYYPGNSSSEPILVQVTIANNGASTVRFKLADDLFFSLDFTAIDTKNRFLDHTETWIRRRNTNRQVFFREISIEPGEAYSFVENVKDYIHIASPGIYVLESSFYPELRRVSGQSGEIALASNRLMLEIKPSPGAAAVSALPVSPVTAEILKPEPLPPDQVVRYMITARQKSHWDQFFLYLDLDQMIQKDPARNRRYRSESESGRFAMIEKYKTDLTQATVDRDISTIPVQFSIERTSYTESEGTVTVISWFDYRTFREKKRFTYFLKSRNGIWYITDYTVDNLGTE